MWQFIRDKQGLALTTDSQILQHLPGIVQFTPANIERNQQARGGIDSRPDPRAPVLTNDRRLEMLARWVLGVTFVYASFHKIIAPAVFAKIIWLLAVYSG